METSVIPLGLCQCGCGGKTSLRARGNKRLGLVKGEPCDFIGNHGVRGNLKKGELHHKWNGGRKLSHGYVLVWSKGHPRADQHGYVFEHVLVAEEMSSGPLPDGVEIHHINGVRDDNSHNNLLICRNHTEHMDIHLKERALKACGNENFRKCPFCKTYDDPAVMRKNGKTYLHVKCSRDYYKKRRMK